MTLLADTGFLEFMTTHGFNPLTPESVQAFYGAIADYETDIWSQDPFEAQVTIRLKRDTFSTTVNEDLTIDDTEL